MEILASLLDIESKKSIGEIELIGDPIPGKPPISFGNPLQCFYVHQEHENLWRTWYEAKPILLKTDSDEQVVRIITFPAEEDREGYEGYLEYLGDK